MIRSEECVDGTASLALDSGTASLVQDSGTASLALKLYYSLNLLVERRAGHSSRLILRPRRGHFFLTPHVSSINMPIPVDLKDDASLHFKT